METWNVRDISRQHSSYDKAVGSEREHTEREDK